MWHKSLWQFQDVKSEVDLILARAAMFTMPQNVNNNNNNNNNNGLYLSVKCI